MPDYDRPQHVVRPTYFCVYSSLSMIPLRNGEPMMQSEKRKLMVKQNRMEEERQ